METSYLLSAGEMDTLFAKLAENYLIYAPVRIHNGGRYALDDTIMYKEVTKYRDIEFHDRSIFSMKEVLTPISQTLFYFTEEEFKEAKVKDERELLIFGRACDLNAVKIQDQVFLENGNEADFFYKRMREKAHFVLMECTEQFDGCFCCSLGTNVTDLQEFSVSFRDEEAFVNVKDNEFATYFAEATPSDYEIKAPEENELQVDFPHLNNKEEYKRLVMHPMWAEYEKRCIGCGKCTIACSTCTCFTTKDVCYTENRNVGERKRTCTSCMLADFDIMAGGHCFRKTIGDRYRFKILHKVYAHDTRFNTGAMCVGCGRCDADCPEQISYSETLHKINLALVEIRQEMASEAEMKQKEALHHV